MPSTIKHEDSFSNMQFFGSQGTLRRGPVNSKPSKVPKPFFRFFEDKIMQGHSISSILRKSIPRFPSK